MEANCSVPGESERSPCAHPLDACEQELTGRVENFQVGRFAIHFDLLAIEVLNERGTGQYTPSYEDYGVETEIHQGF